MIDAKAGGMGIGVDDVIQFIEAALPVVKSMFGLDATRGGQLGGAPDQLQPLNAHGGEYVVNENAAQAFRPQLEQINSSVPPDPSVRPEVPLQGPAFFAGGGADGDTTGGGNDGISGATSPGPDSDAPAGPSSMGDNDPGLTAATAPAADDPSDPGFALSDPANPPTNFGPIYSFSPSPTSMIGHQPGMRGFNPGGNPGNTDPSTGTPIGFDPSNANDPVTAALMAQMAVPASSIAKSALLGAIPGNAPFGLEPNTAAQNNVASALSMATGALSGVPGIGTAVGMGLGAGMGAANATADAVAAALGISPAEAMSALGTGHSASADTATGQAGELFEGLTPPVSARRAPSPQVPPGASVPTGGFSVSPLINPSNYRSTETSQGLAYDDSRRRSNGFRVGV